MTVMAPAQVTANHPAISASVPSGWNDRAVTMTAPTARARATFLTRCVRVTATRFFQRIAPAGQPCGRQSKQGSV